MLLRIFLPLNMNVAKKREIIFIMKTLLEYSKDDRKRISQKIGTITLIDVIEEKSDYLAFRSNKDMDLTVHRELELEVIRLLENLGYSLEEMGTFFYKDVIVGIVDALDCLTESDYKTFLESLNSPFSQFYFNLARNERDIGTKSFHEYISKAHLSIDVRKANRKIVTKLYKNRSRNMNYGEYALFLAKYVKDNIVPRIGKIKNKKKKTNLKLEIK